MREQQVPATLILSEQQKLTPMDSQRSSCLVIIPTHNERDNLGPLLTQILFYLPEADVLIVDDNSSDGTKQLVIDWTNVEPRIHLLARPRKLGLGSAYLAGFAWALDEAYDYVMQMDADFSHSPSALPQLFGRVRADIDIIVGSRYVAGADIGNWSYWRYQMSVFANRFAKTLLKIPTNDLSSGFRCLSRSALSRLSPCSYSPGYVFQVELTFHAFQLGLRVEEVPIRFTARMAGKSKLSAWESVQWLRALMRLSSHSAQR